VGILTTVERSIRGLVEGAFGKAFGGRVHPAEIAKALLARMRETECPSGHRPIVANQYTIRLSRADFAAIEQIRPEVQAELLHLLRVTADSEDWDMPGPLRVGWDPDPRLSEGQMFIEAEFVAGLPRGWLRVIRGPLEGREFALNQAETTIGRAPGNHIVLQDSDVSRLHAVVHAVGDRFILEDRESTNGTYVNHKQVTHARLATGDLIELGGTILAFERGV